MVPHPDPSQYREPPGLASPNTCSNLYTGTPLPRAAGKRSLGLLLKDLAEDRFVPYVPRLKIIVRKTRVIYFYILDDADNLPLNVQIVLL